MVTPILACQVRSRPWPRPGVRSVSTSETRNGFTNPARRAGSPDRVLASRGHTADMANRALEALEAAGIEHRVIRHEPVNSLAEAAAARGVEPADVVKTLVVRRSDHDFLFILVPGDRTISWPKLRSVVGVSRLSLPDARLAREATGYERGTITPFGSVTSWPVIADERMRGRGITLGGGERGLAVAVDADAVLQVLDAQVADITDPEPIRSSHR